MPIQFLVSTVPVSLSTSFYAVFAFLFSSKSFLFNIPVYLLLSDSFCIPLFFLHSIFFIFPQGAPKRKYLSNRRNADTKQNLFSQVSSVRLDSPAPALFLFSLSLTLSFSLFYLSEFRLREENLGYGSAAFRERKRIEKTSKQLQGTLKYLFYISAGVSNFPL